MPMWRFIPTVTAGSNALAGTANGIGSAGAIPTFALALTGTAFGIGSASGAALSFPLAAADTFTDTAGTAITSHTPDSGGPWQGMLGPNTASSTTFLDDPALITTANGIRPSNSGPDSNTSYPGWRSSFYALAGATLAGDHLIACDLTIPATILTTGFAPGLFGVLSRMSATAITCYHFRAYFTGGTFTWDLYWDNAADYAASTGFGALWSATHASLVSSYGLPAASAGTVFHTQLLVTQTNPTTTRLRVFINGIQVADVSDANGPQQSTSGAIYAGIGPQANTDNSSPSDSNLIAQDNFRLYMVGAALAGNATGTGSASGTLAEALPLAGNTVGTGSASATISESLPLAGTATGTGSAHATITEALPLSGVALGAGSASATPTEPLPLVGSITGIGSASATPTLPLPLAGTATGTGSASGTATIPGANALVGSASGVGSTTATPTLSLPLAGTSTGIGSASGMATLPGGNALAGAATGTGSASGGIVLSFPLAGTSSGVGMASAIAAYPLILAGGVAGTGSASATPTMALLLAGLASGIGSATATAGGTLITPLRIFPAGARLHTFVAGTRTRTFKAGSK